MRAKKSTQSRGSGGPASAPAQKMEAELGGSETTGDEKQRARGGGKRRDAAKERAAGKSRADDGDADGDARESRSVAADELQAKPARGAAHAEEKTTQPSAGFFRGERELKKKPEGPRAHGGEIAGGAGEGFVADGFGRMEGIEKMDAFERGVHAADKFATRGGAEDSGIVAKVHADARERRVARAAKGALNAANEIVFSERGFCGDVGHGNDGRARIARFPSAEDGNRRRGGAARARTRSRRREKGAR
jgi:hypothetical protein